VNTALFLAEWTLRSSMLIGAGALLLWMFRVKDPSVRLAAWIAALMGSLAMPVLTSSLPALRLPPIELPVLTTASDDLATPPPLTERTPEPRRRASTPAVATGNDSRREANRLDRPSASPRRWLFPALALYVIGAVVLIARMLRGLALSRRLRRRTARTGMTIDGIEIRVSTSISAPVTLGLLRPIIVLPVDWREWDAITLQSVLAHERSHVRRRDPAVQLLSLVHRAALWHNPLAWFLHQCIVRTAEDASDDAALAATGDRATYAEVLLRFMERGLARSSAVGVPMARYGSPVQRIDRILEGTVVSHGVGHWSGAAITAIGVSLACIAASAQARPEFEVADVRATPLRADGRASTVMEGGGAVRGGRYEIHNATLVDLIRTAFDIRTDAVIGGPSWLALDRFDVIAKVSDNASSDSVEPMLQSLLADRFELDAHRDTRPLPAWVLSKGATAPKLKPAAKSGEAGCRGVYELDRLSCRNVTLDTFVAWLREGPHTALPVMNSTGIEGSWDFDLDNLELSRSRGVSEGNPILGAVDRQLGLKLAIERVPQPVVVVNSVNRTPTRNLPGIETRLPPDPVEFEVASIRPCQMIDPRTTQGDTGQRISPSGQLTTGCQSLRMHIVSAWNIGSQVRAMANVIFPNMANTADIQGAPSWLGSRSFNIVAKAPVAVTRPLVNDAKYRAMLRNLLANRFKMKTHYENRPVDVYTLVATRPTLQKADPSSRTGCRSNGLVVGAPTFITCQNVTMAQLADELNRSWVIGTTGRRVVDETGIQGTWNLTLTYRVVPPAPPTPGAAPEPTGEVSPFEAIEKQLGLELREAKRPMPVFVIDHIEEMPTEN
jgi:uncharacterized protein (TIGR03435 family)